MGAWLADKRRDQDSDFIQRFDPRFWTVNFPRPAMASVRTTAADALRVDAVFYHSDELVGLIWESEDRLDHPLLAYETLRDYDRLQIGFHWRSSGVRPLDAINGPTLTIEGRDASGAARSWYVRLWNYATGTATDAQIDLNFAALDGGFLLPGEADPVFPQDIDRMFISIIPPDYDPSGHNMLAAPAQAWVELTDIRADGQGAILEIGDILVPPHELGMATAYDDSFNQTPERLLRSIHALGYRNLINHYVGMSHYFRLTASGGDHLVSLGTPQPGEESAALNQPCLLWHRDYAERAKALDYAIIWSLSYELFDAHCPEDWKQRAENGDPALTGWVPPSTLLSPANAVAMDYLQAVGAAFIAIAQDAGMDLKFQVGEPWWWIMLDDHRICLYDDAAQAAFGALSVAIPTIRAAMNAAQQAMLDKAGEILAQSTADLVAAVRAAAGATPVEAHLLAYLPTILDAEAPDARRANLPLDWAAPAFDVLQLEDYDWVISGAFARTAEGVAAATERLNYPIEDQHYFSGFVFDPADRFIWANMVQAIAAAATRGSERTFVWALPQVARDGFTYFAEKEAAVQPFDDVLFPFAIGQAATVSPAFSTGIATMLSGHEHRNSDWSDARMEFDVGPGIRCEGELRELLVFFRARRGAAKAFRFRDPTDFSSRQMVETPTMLDQIIGTGDGETTRFQLVKYYGDPELPDGAQQRIITRPVADSIAVSVDGVLHEDWTLAEGGQIDFATAPAADAIVRAGFLFDVPVRFAQDRLEIAGTTFAAGEAVSVPLIEIRE